MSKDIMNQKDDDEADDYEDLDDPEEGGSLNSI